jgi:2',3'-cyclic-nucleotide 2'-phosphodiesterase (5'-nucleotidase family)
MRQPGGFIDWWGYRHLSSNIGMTETNEPLSNRYMVLEGKNSRILVFGFIYHLKDPSEEVTVYDPADVTKEDWFKVALQVTDYDAILVMAHMGTDDESVAVIHDAIREIVGDLMPIQFVCGHTHLRRSAQLDPLSKAVEAGKYLDTIGFVSFPNLQNIEDRNDELRPLEDSTALFQHVFLDANVNMLKYALDDFGEGFATTDGQELQEFIQRTQNRLGLDKVLGCAPNDYFQNRSIHDHDSLWKVYRDKVVPTQLERDPEANRAILVSQASWRYDISQGENMYDDVVAISPFNEPVYFIGSMPCDIVLELNETLNKAATDNFYEVLPAYILAGTVKAGKNCELFSHHFELRAIFHELMTLHPAVSFIAKPTNLTSTTIWTGFLEEEWPCDGQKGVHIPWLDDHKIFDENGNTNGKNLAIVVSVSVLCTLLLCGLLVTCWRSLNYMCVGRQTMTEEEINSFNEKVGIEAEYA